MTDQTNDAAADAQTALIEAGVPLSTPLEWPIVDPSGTLLLAAGATLADEASRAFLFRQFRPHRGDLPQSPAFASQARQADAGHKPVTIEDMRIAIGSRLGLRSQVGMGRAMHSARVIGFAPNGALFVTWPLQARELVAFREGEQVDIVAIGAQAVFLFPCTVQALQRSPFDYLVLSQPGVVRRLRDRRSIRVPVRMAVQYARVNARANDGAGQPGGPLDGLGASRDLGTHGLSMVAPTELGKVSDAVRIVFRVRTKGIDIAIETVATIRNINDLAAERLVLYGLEFAGLDSQQEIALKTFAFDHQDPLHMATWVGV